MASGETTRRKLKYPKTTDSYKITKDLQELAEELDNGGPWLFTEKTAAYEAKAGDWVGVSKTATITMPTPTANTWVAISNLCTGATEEATIKQHSTDEFFGAGIVGLKEFKLKQYQSVIMEATGTNWLILAGNPVIPWVSSGALSNGWAATNGIKYRRELGDVVRLWGTFTTIGTTGVEIFKLNEGYRPTESTEMVAPQGGATTGTGATEDACHVVVETDGKFKIFRQQTSAISIHGLTFTTT